MRSGLMERILQNLQHRFLRTAAEREKNHPMATGRPLLRRGEDKAQGDRLMRFSRKREPRLRMREQQHLRALMKLRVPPMKMAFFRKRSRPRTRSVLAGCRSREQFARLSRTYTGTSGILIGVASPEFYAWAGRASTPSMR